MNRFFLAFDDTDVLGAPGTGHLLDAFLKQLPGQCSLISRHQLYVHSDVPFTSHNSAMCAEVVTDQTEDTLVQQAAAFLEQHSAQGADPGLCVADLARMQHREELVFWGYRAKKEVLTKADAYALAERCRVHLSEHGGTGQGVVGALAAVGLRLAGQDGRVKGKQQLEQDVMTVAELLDRTGFDRVCAYGEGVLPPEAMVHLGGQPIKAVFQDFCATVLVIPCDGGYKLVPKDQLKCF